MKKKYTGFGGHKNVSFGKLRISLTIQKKKKKEPHHKLEARLHHAGRDLKSGGT